MNEIIHEKIITGALETNCWIVPLEGAAPDGLAPAAVIDPGGDADKIISCLERRKLYPKCILLTHGHFDHIEALPAIHRHYSGIGAAPQVAIHGEDLMYLGADSLAAHRRSFAAAGAPYYVDQLWESMPDADTTLAEGDKIEIFTVLHLPGHTKGSIAFFDKTNGRLYSGDTLFNAGVGRTDLPGGDTDALEASLARLFKLDGNIAVFPGHGPSTTIAHESHSAHQWV